MGTPHARVAQLDGATRYERGGWEFKSLHGYQMKTVWWISGPKWTFAVVEEDGVVVEAAPISKWGIGHTIDKVIDWWLSKGADRIKQLRSY